VCTFLYLIICLSSLFTDSDSETTKTWTTADIENQWISTSESWEGSDPGGALGIGVALQSLPMGESETEEAAEVDSEGLPSYRAASRSSKSYGAPPVPAANAMPVRNIEDLTPEEVALEEYLMNQAVDAGMWLHHEKLEKAHSRYSVSMRFGQILEDVENEDIRRGAAPVVPGTGLKMPSWIRASEELLPQLDALNAATIKAEIEANEAEVKRVRDSIMEEVEAAAQLLAVTDPFAGVSLEDPTAAPEALDDLFGDLDTLLPGARTDMFSTDLMEDMMKDKALYDAGFAGDGGGSGGFVDENITKTSLSTALSGISYLDSSTEGADDPSQGKTEYELREADENEGEKEKNGKLGEESVDEKEEDIVEE
jgi:hypothetical protein